MAVSSTPKCETKPVVIGYGSPIRQDDGMGWRAAELLRQALPPHVATALEDHQLTPELTVSLRDAPLVIFLDAAADLRPGAIRLQALGPMQDETWSHHLVPEQLLQLAKQVNGSAPNAFLISGGVQEMKLSEELTETGQACAKRIADLARRIINRLG